MSRDDTDDALLAELAAALGPDTEPPREVLAAARASLAWRTVDAELAALTHDSLLDGGPVGVRSTDQPRILTFEAGDVTIELEVDQTTGARRLIGQVVPAQAAELDLLVVEPTPAGRPARPGAATDGPIRADDWGRFTLPLPAARVRVALDLRLVDGTAVRSSTILV